MVRLCISAILMFGFIAGCDETGQDFDTPDEIAEQSRPVKTGASVLLNSYLNQLSDRNIGLVANPTARVGDTHLLDTLLAKNINIVALFAPEHGFRGDRPAGEEISDGIDNETGLPVFSLYGNTRKPTPDMLSKTDLLIFDMQDVGVRFYTYISTLALVLEAASEHNVEVWVLDRPNPLGGEYVSGFMLEEVFTSFVGMFPIPVAHGMTIGELAGMMVSQNWIEFENKPNVKVIPMQHWHRDMVWPDTELDWRAPSPNLPHFSNALVYPGTCFLEGTTLSEGRGTPEPFMLVGAPKMQIPDSTLTRIMSAYPVLLERRTFTPVTIPGVASNPKFEGKTAEGVLITPQTLNPVALRPVEFGLELTREMLRYTPDSSVNRFMYNLAGTRQIDAFLDSYKHPAHWWIDEVNEFLRLREPYLLYD